MRSAKKNLVAPSTTHRDMGSRYDASVLTSVVWDSLAGIFILLPFTAIAQADQGLSLGPSPTPRECDTLTARWPLAHSNPPFYSVEIVDEGSSQTLFQTHVTGPAHSVTWVVSATGGASLHLAIHTPPDLNANHYAATDFQVHSGSSTCFPLVRCALFFVLICGTERRFCDAVGFTNALCFDTRCAAISRQWPP